MQRPNPRVRGAIVSAAAQEFAARGYEAATMPAIARRAGTAAGNVYRYFSGKKALYDAVLPRPLVGQLKAKLRDRVAAFGSDRHDAALHELVRFTREHRERAVLLLSTHRNVRAELVGHLVKLALAWVRRERPKVKVDAAMRHALELAYDGLLVSTVRCLQEHREDAIAPLTRYHLAGLGALLS